MRYKNRRNNRRYRTNYENERVKQELELNRYYNKPLLEKTEYLIEKGAKKYDAFLEGLRVKGSKAKQTFGNIKGIIAREARKTKAVAKQISPDLRPIPGYFQRTSRNFTGIRYRPIPLFRGG